jgi:hypothetical protein
VTHSAANSNAFSRSTALRRRLGPLWARRAPVWLAAAGVFTILALLLSFQQVVQGAVTQSAERHKTTALLASATRECKALRSPAAIDRCTEVLKKSSSEKAVQTAFFSGF